MHNLIIKSQNSLNLVVSIPLCAYTILLECAAYTQQTVISCNLLQLVNLLANNTQFVNTNTCTTIFLLKNHLKNS